jgi:CRP/FNR family transcriptional regulator, cyclic AMP receptor protein
MVSISDPQTLAEIPLFRDLTADELMLIAPLLRSKKIGGGKNIITMEQPGETVYIILEGAVKIVLEQATGANVLLAVLGPGEVVGEMSVVDSLERSASVLTLEESTVLWIDRRSFWQCLRSMPTLTYNLLGILSRRVRLANAHIEALGAQDVYGRVAGQILALAREYGQAAADGNVLIPLRLTQNDFASLVGASRVRVNQVLSFYRQHNFISMDHDFRITVHDSAALAQRCR